MTLTFFVSLNKRKIEQKSKLAAWEKASETMQVTTRREGWDLKSFITAILQLLGSTFNKNNFFMYVYVNRSGNLTRISKDSANASKLFTVRTKKPHVFGFYALIKTFKIIYRL